MSTKLTKADEKPNATESLDVKSASTLESWQKPAEIAPVKPPVGKGIINVMTEQETADLLARLQDILSLWAGSDNKIIGSYVMTAFPIPSGIDITKLTKTNGHDKVFCVNGKSVVGLD